MADARVRGAVITTGVPTVSARVRTGPSLRAADADAITAHARFGEAEGEGFVDAIEGDADALTATAALGEAEGEAFRREGDSDAIAATAAFGEAEGEASTPAGDADALTARAALGEAEGEVIYNPAARWVRRFRYRSDIGVGDIRLWFEDSATSQFSNGHNLNALWESGVESLRFSQGALSAVVDGPTNTGNTTTDDSDSYVWEPSAEQAAAVAAFFDAIDVSQDVSLTFRITIETFASDADAITARAGLGEAEGEASIAVGDADALTATAALGEAEGEGFVEERAGDADAITAAASLGEAEGETAIVAGDADSIAATAVLGEAEGEVPTATADADALTATAALGEAEGESAVDVPVPVTTPYPVDGATGQSIGVDLGWERSVFTMHYEVFLGQQQNLGSTHRVATDLDARAFDPGELLPNTTYYWRVDSINLSLTATGTTWSFTTGAAPVAPVASTANESASLRSRQPFVNLEAEEWLTGTETPLVPTNEGRELPPPSREDMPDFV